MPTPRRQPGNLPAESTSFVGRRHELSEARRKLATARLVSLVGPGGVGKTRLAVRIATDLARGFPDGAWLVELAELRDPTLVSNAVLAALDLRDQAAAEPAALLRSYLRDRQLLLVVDNCEHLLDAAARLVDDVLKMAPGVRVITTSREPLTVAGEHVLPVPPLTLPTTAESLGRLRENEAVRLFVVRAAAATGHFELSAGNQTAVVELCRRLDGLPLAIELAAVRTRALGAEQILDRLSSRFDLLTSGSRAALPRHQTMHTTIEWSYELLTPAEQTLLARLSVFAGRFTLENVEAVCCFDELIPADSLNLVSSLLDKSLVAMEDGGCYRLHETMREYARLKLRADGSDHVLDQRCADYYLAQCLRFAAEGRQRLVEWLAWIQPQVDNLRALLRRFADQGDRLRGVTLATSLIWFWVTRATTEGVRWLDEFVAPDAPTTPWAYFARGFLAVLQNDPTAAIPVLDRGVAVARSIGPADALSQLLAMASISANQAGDRVAAERLLDEARRTAEGLDDLGATLMVHQAQALNGLHDGDVNAVRAAAMEGARLSRAAGDLYSLDMMLMNQGFAALWSSDVSEAEARFTEALPIAAQIDDRVAQCYLLGGIGACASANREPRLAAQLLGAMENLRAEIGAAINVGIAPALSRASAAARRSLGESRFSTEFQSGERLSRDAAIRLARRESPALAPTSSAEPVLGAREVDVARLVAEGLSNREIGARLFISERTVESHVRNILNKLGFNSRAQIASWMAASR